MCSPMSPTFGAQNLIDSPSNQLLRSKSLNDISSNSLVLAPDLSINFQGYQQQHRQTGNSVLDSIHGPNLTSPYDAREPLTNVVAPTLHQISNGTTCMAMEHDIYNQRPDINNLRTSTTSSNYNAFNDHSTNGQFNQHQASTFYKDPNDNQCSNNNKQNTSSVTNSTSSANMFNICNPIVMNLNGVTEQIGNLHL
jgi:hypothetical protein